MIQLRLVLCHPRTTLSSIVHLSMQYPKGPYRENTIAIECEARDPNGGNVYYDTMQIMFPIPEFARK